MALGTTTYTAVTWTGGDTITEAKMDSMVDNDQAYDSHASNGLLVNNNVGYYQKDSGGTNRAVVNVDASNNLTIGDSNLNENAINTQCKFLVGLSSPQSIPDNTWTKVEYDTEIYDIGGDFDNASGYDFTVPVTGYYLLYTQGRVDDLDDGDNMQVAIYVDGTIVRRTIGYSANAADIIQMGLTTVEYLTAAQVVYSALYHNEGAAQNATGSENTTYFGGHLLSV